VLSAFTSRLSAQHCHSPTNQRCDCFRVAIHSGARSGFEVRAGMPLPKLPRRSVVADRLGLGHSRGAGHGCAPAERRACGGFQSASRPTQTARRSFLPDRMVERRYLSAVASQWGLYYVLRIDISISFHPIRGGTRPTWPPHPFCK